MISKSLIKYYAKIIFVMSVAAIPGGLVVGSVKFVVELLYGHPMVVAFHVALAFFLGISIAIFLIATGIGLTAIHRRVKAAGITMEQLSRLSSNDRNALMRKNWNISSH